MTRALPLAIALLCWPGIAAAADKDHDLVGHWKGTSGTTLTLKQPGRKIVRWTAHSKAPRGFEHKFKGELDGDTIMGHFRDEPGFDAYNEGDITATILNDCRIKITDITYQPIQNEGRVAATGEVFNKKPCTKDTTYPSVKAFPASGQVGKKMFLRFKVKDDCGQVEVVLTVSRGDKVLSQRHPDNFIDADGSIRTLPVTPGNKYVGRTLFTVRVKDRAGHEVADTAVIMIKE